MKATLTSKGQITIPIKIRQRLRLRAGDVLDFDESAPFLVGRPVFDEQAMRDAIGSAEVRLNSTAWIDETRGPVANPP